MLDQHRKGIHEQFSQILSAIGKNKTPKLDAQTFAITTISGTSTRDPPFPTSSQPTTANHTGGTTKEEGPEGEESSIMQNKESTQSPTFYHPSKLSSAMIHMSKGAKVLKDLLSHKEKLKKSASLVKLSKGCSAVIQRSLPQKEGDPGILEMDEDELVLIILGWPFLATARAVIDVHEGKLTLGLALLKLSRRKEGWPWSRMRKTSSYLKEQLPDGMLERLAGHEYYCFLDRFLGYFQIPIALEDQEKTTFTCPYDTFTYKRMPFGLCNAPTTFQCCMTAIFYELIEDSIEVFMDDFSIFGISFDHCLKNLEKMLMRCEETNLVLNWEKCHFMVKEGIILGHKVSPDARIRGGIEGKIKSISKLPYPTNVKAIQSFLRHACFYRRFIKDFSQVVHPMTQLLMKDPPFNFFEECIQDFNKLKQELTRPPIRIKPDWPLPFEIMCDASDCDVRAVLGQRKDKHFQPIHYASKTMKIRSLMKNMQRNRKKGFVVFRWTKAYSAVRMWSLSKPLSSQITLLYGISSQSKMQNHG
ncbi:reverse transcriptase domain-containing protein [Tanacetum coccineum]